MKVLLWEMRTKKNCTLMQLAEKNRNRKEYAKQHRKRENVPHVVPA